MKILILAQECDATSMVYNAFKDEFEQVDLILEQKVDRKTFFKRRIKNLGWKKVLGQITFKILLEPFIKLQGKRRIKNIIQDYHLNPNKDYQMNHLYRVNSVNSDECRALLLKLKPDVVIVNGTRIISEKTLETTTAPFINMHTGITPKYRGVHGAYWALTQNDRQNCGVTIHRVDTGIDTGVQQLAIGGNNLTNGLTNLSTNLFTLSDSLNKANQQLSLVSVNSENAKIVSAPLKVKKTDKDKVDTNGVGMAPYMISVSLMVVALSTNVIFAKSLTGRSFTSRFDWSKNKLFINGIIATMAAIALYIAIRFMGVEPNHPLATFGMILLAAWTLMALVTALVGWDDRYGAFASMILLLLQLGSSAGTYPIELSPKFFKVVQPFLPMSYSVSGLRQTISMTGQISDQVRMLVIFLLTFVVVGIVIYRPKTENV